MLLNLETLVKKYDLKINGVIHIGAHYGQEFTIYENNEIKNQIFFEPLEKNFKVLESEINGKYPIFKLALGNKTGEVEMFVESANSGMSSSVLEPLIVLKQYPHIIFNEKEIVQMKRLDDIHLDLENLNFINIDVQGYELEVFKGATNTLKYIDCIMTEINREELYKDCTKVEELTDFLSEFGFILVEETWDGGSWGDGFYVKKK